MREDRKERAIWIDATTRRATASSTVLSACRVDRVGAIDCDLTLLETLLTPVTKFVLALISGWGTPGSRCACHQALASRFSSDHHAFRATWRRRGVHALGRRRGRRGNVFGSDRPRWARPAGDRSRSSSRCV
jgi:hypothetical protein